MICFVITWPQKTLRKLRGLPGMPEHRVWSYDRLFRAWRFPFATWIFTDFDRLGTWELELAARTYRMLQRQGMRVINDPAEAVGRFDLLQRLHAAGLNRFAVWRTDALDTIDRWPVFLRTEAAHRGPLTDLIHNRRDLQAQVDHAVARGHPVRDLMVVEYCAQPLRPGLFRKHAAFRMGERLLPTLAVHDTNWVAKYGKLGAGDAACYQEELDTIGCDLADPGLHQAFQLARLEYGRVDYALVDGMPQIYEINSNPTIGRLKEHPSPLRLKSAGIAERRMIEAFQEMDSIKGKGVFVSDKTLVKQRKHDCLMTRSRWVL